MRIELDREYTAVFRLEQGVAALSHLRWTEYEYNVDAKTRGSIEQEFKRRCLESGMICIKCLSKAPCRNGECLDCRTGELF